ncbi:folate-binding protein YgfZ [Modicisalibacter tunisiensis]|uniref:CAF17-like 4Fe-4S cluster assembly/insertion protein YgfZ n=1 Tax=Modicisalibacter tunisiensis TaxID=390637 RepID=UPI001CC9EECF|nr:folate-binding protein [Modicisalibacter tunisiensis]MBZ9538194.1 folate-binding protein YgfZ [Modicisalibacter tunisiensis]
MTDWNAYLDGLGARRVDDRHRDFGDPHQAHQAQEATALMPLVHLGVLEVSGSDAKRFLQGQTSAQLDLADGDLAAPTAFCTPKGRMLANAQLLHPAPDTYWLVMTAGLVAPLRAHLGKFAPFYQVTLRARDDLALIGLSGRDAPALLETRLDVRPPAVWYQARLGEGVVLRHPGSLPRLLLCLPTAAAREAWEALARNAVAMGNAVWQWQDVQAGLAWLDAGQQDAYLPQMFNWEALGGVSFKKGCYTGQEVVARAHFRGQVKKRLVRAQLGGATLPTIGDEVTDADGKPRGEVVAAALDGYGQAEVLAVLTTREVPEPLSVAGQPLQRLKLPYPVERLDPEAMAAGDH